MADSFSVKFLDEDLVRAAIKRLEEQVGSSKGVPQKIIATEGMQGVRDAFAMETSPEGFPWRPTKFRSGKTLQDTLSLLGSIRAEINGTEVSIGTDDPRAPRLHFGGTILPKNRYLAVMMPGMTYKGSLRSQYPNAFVLALGGKSYGTERLWLVKKTADYANLPRNQRGKNSHEVPGHGKLQFIALLVSHVDIPERHFIGISAATEDRIINRLSGLARMAWGDQ